MVGDLGRLRQVIAVGVRLKDLVNAQQVVCQKQAGVQRFFSSRTDVGPERQKFQQRQARSVEQFPDSHQLLQEIRRDFVMHPSCIGTAQFKRLVVSVLTISV